MIKIRTTHIKPHFFLLLFCLLISIGSTVLGETIVVPIGKTLTMSLKSQGQLHLSNGKIVKLREQFGKILVTGIKVGESTITSRSATHNIYVLEEQDFNSYNHLKDAIAKMHGLNILIFQDRIFISGKLLRFSDWEILYKLSSQHNLRWVLKAEIEPEISDQITTFTSDTIKNSNLSVPPIVTQPTLQVSISKLNKNNQLKYRQLLEPMGFQIIEDSTALEIEPMVDLKVQIVELKKSSFQKLGVDLPTSYKAQILPTDAFKVVGTTFDVALNLLEQEGSARIIASPHISCRSGQEANFLAGGEFPIKIINFQTSDLQWKKHGIMLNFKPLADRSGKMSLSLAAEISTLDPSQTVDGVPGVLVNRVSSHLDLIKSQTIALSGLIREQFGKSSQGAAGLKDIPVLGALFSSQDYREERTDLVIFVTPQVLKE